jgi:hypothetical protein
VSTSTNSLPPDAAQAELLFDASPPPAGDPTRFVRRWRLIGAGLCNVWRFGDLTLDTPSGRLLMRGANGTGKTTVLEALCPYLLDLNQAKLAAGKARPTTLASLMREGAEGKRRTGYVWLIFALPQTLLDDEQAVNPDVRPERSWGCGSSTAQTPPRKCRSSPSPSPDGP